MSNRFVVAVAIGAALSCIETASAVSLVMQDVQSRLRSLPQEFGEVRVQRIALGESAVNRPLVLLHFHKAGSADGSAGPKRTKPALLVVGGIDPRMTSSPDVVLDIAEAIAQGHAASLEHADLYVLPMLGPDGGAETSILGLSSRQPAEPGTDADRDRRSQEDPPRDMNGDGVISTMRVRNPRVGSGLRATHITEPGEPRLMRAADAAKGEQPEYAVLVEGTDADGDGQFSEDGPWGVDLNRNFPYQWTEHDDDAGWTPLSAPETRALATWLLDNPQVVGLFVHQSSDTIVNPPAAGKFDQTGEAPALGQVLEADKPIFDAFSKRFREQTKHKDAPKASNAGSLVGWAYAQLGLFAYGSPAWVRPDQMDPPKSQAAKPNADEKPRASVEGKDTKEADGTASEASPPAAAKAEPKRASEVSRPSRIDSEDGKWLELIDEWAKAAASTAPGADGAAPDTSTWFTKYSSFNHPILGPVEIGGFRPLTRFGIPEQDRQRVAQEQAQILAEWLSKLPRLMVDSPVVEAPGSPAGVVAENSVFRVSLRIRNVGQLPTKSAMGIRTRRLPPLRATLDLEPDRIHVGLRSQRTETLGPGAEFIATWTVSGRAGSEVVARVSCPEVGTDLAIVIPLNVSSTESLDAQPGAKP